MNTKQFSIPWPLASIMLVLSIFIVTNWATKGEKCDVKENTKKINTLLLFQEGFKKDLGYIIKSIDEMKKVK